MSRLDRQRDTKAASAPPLLLASASPRRRDLLGEAGQEFEVDPSGVAETPLAGEEPEAFACRTAREKALEVAGRRPGCWVLAADTIVVLDGELFGKPVDAGDARRMLERLSGHSHDVLTAFAIASPAGGIFAEKLVRTRVAFRPLDAEEIRAYVDGGEPLGKAGAYAIQGGAGRFVVGLEGSYTNVVGLPIDEVREALSRAGVWRDRP
ncbi:MAG: Maf family protein [Candidatus Binatia bacterium]